MQLPQIGRYMYQQVSATSYRFTYISLRHIFALVNVVQRKLLESRMQKFCTWFYRNFLEVLFVSNFDNRYFGDTVAVDIEMKFQPNWAKNCFCLEFSVTERWNKK